MKNRRISNIAAIVEMTRAIDYRPLYTFVAKRDIPKGTVLDFDSSYNVVTFKPEKP